MDGDPFGRLDVDEELSPREGGRPSEGGGRNPTVDFRGNSAAMLTIAPPRTRKPAWRERVLAERSKLRFAGHGRRWMWYLPRPPAPPSGSQPGALRTHRAVPTGNRGCVQELRHPRVCERLPGQGHDSPCGATRVVPAGRLDHQTRWLQPEPEVAQAYRGDLRSGPRPVGDGRKLRYKNVARNQLGMELTLAAYNLVRMAELLLSRRKPLEATYVR